LYPTPYEEPNKSYNNEISTYFSCFMPFQLFRKPITSIKPKHKPKQMLLGEKKIYKHIK